MLCLRIDGCDIRWLPSNIDLSCLEPHCTKTESKKAPCPLSGETFKSLARCNSLVAMHPMATSHCVQVAVQSVKAMPDNKVPEIWGESVTQQGAKIAVELARQWRLRMRAQNDERKA